MRKKCVDDAADGGNAERNETKPESNAGADNWEVERECRECKANCELESSDAAESGDVKRESQKAENTDATDSDDAERNESEFGVDVEAENEDMERDQVPDIFDGAERFFPV